MSGTRVLKAHVSAVTELLPTLTPAEAFEVAEAVLCAEDGRKTRYVVGMRAPSGGALIYGPYVTSAAAMRVIEIGTLGTGIESIVGVFPLIPAPKRTKRLKAVEQIHRDSGGFAVTKRATK